MARLGILVIILAASGCGNSGAKVRDARTADADNGASGVSVFQHHKTSSRDGVFVDPAFTKAAAMGIHIDPAFSAPLSGPVYTQPLFLEGAIGGKDVLVIASELNVVYALDAATGAQIWQTPPLASPVNLASLPCGNIDPLGITGTPYVDLGTRTIYLGAMTTPDGGATKKHMIYALSLDDGSVRSGWPLDVGAAIPGFMSDVQNQRGAVLVLDGTLYVPYGGHYGDCGGYHGWLVGVDLANPANVKAWSTSAQGGGAWSAGGVSTDGTSLYVTTGNTFNVSTWGGGDAVVRLGRGPQFSGAAADYYAPSNWKQLDTADLDMGTHALVTAPSLTPSALVAGLGKDGNLYLMDHANLGGVGHELSKNAVAVGEINGAVTTYTTAAGTYIAFRVNGSGASCPNGRTGNMVAVKLAGTPPHASVAWCANETDQSLPITSMTDASGSDAIVWNMGSQLYAYDGETGTELFSGGSLANVHYFNTPIIAKGHLYLAGDSELYSFSL
jgi:hypothetical protein